MTEGRVLSVSRDAGHNFSKPVCDRIVLLEGLGVEGDAHCGRTVQHRSRLASTPDAPNLRQVHLLSSEILGEIAEKGFDIAPGDLGENILTEGLHLLSLPRGTLLRVGTAEIEVTGLRNPCAQIAGFRPGLLAAVLERRDGELVRRAGIMGVVRKSGQVAPGDTIDIDLPSLPHVPLERV